MKLCMNLQSNKQGDVYDGRRFGQWIRSVLNSDGPSEVYKTSEIFGKDACCSAIEEVIRSCKSKK